MATNTSALKTFAQQTRIKLVSLITTKLQYVLSADTAELRGYENQINTLREQIAQKGEAQVIEEVAYTWFNRVMALRFMDANEYNSPKVVTPGEGQMRPEILQTLWVALSRTIYASRLTICYCLRQSSTKSYW
jgi:hypothetical protein